MIIGRCRENVGVTVVVAAAAAAVRDFSSVVATTADADAVDRVGRTSRRAGNKVVFHEKHCFQCRRREHPFERHFVVF